MYILKHYVNVYATELRHYWYITSIYMLTYASIYAGVHQCICYHIMLA